MSEPKPPIVCVLGLVMCLSPRGVLSNPKKQDKMICRPCREYYHLWKLRQFQSVMKLPETVIDDQLQRRRGRDKEAKMLPCISDDPNFENLPFVQVLLRELKSGKPKISDRDPDKRCPMKSDDGGHHACQYCRYLIQNTEEIKAHRCIFKLEAYSEERWYKALQAMQWSAARCEGYSIYQHGLCDKCTILIEEARDTKIYQDQGKFNTNFQLKPEHWKPL